MLGLGCLKLTRGLACFGNGQLNLGQAEIHALTVAPAPWAYVQTRAGTGAATTQ
jgi:hypothetical protein